MEKVLDEVDSELMIDEFTLQFLSCCYDYCKTTYILEQLKKNQRKNIKEIKELLPTLESSKESMDNAFLLLPAFEGFRNKWLQDVIPVQISPGSKKRRILERTSTQVMLI
jgi:hypothetical protein